MNASAPLSRDSLISLYETYSRPQDEWLIGAEFERHLLHTDGTPLPYFGEPGVKWLLNRIADRGWTVHSEGDNPIHLEKNGTHITLEPGGQFELSGRPFDNIQQVADETVAFSRMVAEMLEGTDITQVAIGYTPFAEIADISWVPKGRYTVMRTHLAQTGTLAHHMMKGTAAIQASYDFSDEADAAMKVGLSTRLGPLITAMFANSPLMCGEPNGWMSWRGRVWTQTDPQRTGFPTAAENFTFEAWVDYLLQVPMMFRQDEEGNWTSAEGQTFAQWFDDPGRPPPTMADWDLHLTSVFPEVRIKRTIEVRGADCVPMPLAMSFVALFKGLFYCSKATGQAADLSYAFARAGTKEERFDEACRLGLEGTVGGGTLAAWAEELVTCADAALGRCAPEDRKWLKPLIHQVESGVSPARTLLRRAEEVGVHQAVFESAA
jgi:glutamate--cysteine ligase